MKLKIESIIQTLIVDSGLSYYREPLFGYAKADDPLFPKLKDIVGSDHLLPHNILPGARSVASFFLPFKKEISQNNRHGQLATREWAEVYIKTNQLIETMTNTLKSSLAAQNVGIESQPPTYFFDVDLLTAIWSHKHVAYICGLGLFGQNHLLITPKGCNGRFGTIILDIDLEPSPRPEQTHQCRYHSYGCHYCQEICPVKALNEPVFKRQLCYQQCLLNDQTYNDLGSCEVCGKCATGPCGYIE